MGPSASPVQVCTPPLHKYLRYRVREARRLGCMRQTRYRFCPRKLITFHHLLYFPVLKARLLIELSKLLTDKSRSTRHKYSSPKYSLKHICDQSSYFRLTSRLRSRSVLSAQLHHFNLILHLVADKDRMTE